MQENLDLLKSLLEQNHPLLPSKVVTAGFDGFVDSIMRVILQKEKDTTPVYFRTIEEFGNYISGKSGSGFSLETEETDNKLGGNMPIMANALSSLGANVNCVGAFGLPVIHPVFTAMHPDCHLYSFANPGYTTALEFTDGKIMLAEMKDLNHANWAVIKTAVGLQKIIELYNNSDLLCHLNWSELDGSNDIWKGLLNEVFTQPGFAAKDKHLFFDLSDCSKRSDDEIKKALNLIGQFKRFCKVIVSLNRNEAALIYKIVFAGNETDNLEVLGEKIYNALKPAVLLVHTSKYALAWNDSNRYKCDSFYTDNPKITTGAGDNFNAGYCTGLLSGLDLQQSLLLANIVSGYYVQNGNSPDMHRLLDYIAVLAANYEG